MNRMRPDDGIDLPSATQPRVTGNKWAVIPSRETPTRVVPRESTPVPSDIR